MTNLLPNDFWVNYNGHNFKIINNSWPEAINYIISTGRNREYSLEVRPRIFLPTELRVFAAAEQPSRDISEPNVAFPAPQLSPPLPRSLSFLWGLEAYVGILCCLSFSLWISVCGIWSQWWLRGWVPGRLCTVHGGLAGRAASCSRNPFSSSSARGHCYWLINSGVWIHT